MPGSAVETLVKFHVSLNVADLAGSIAFYRILLGVEPAKVRNDYAKFELAEPALILSLIPGKPGGNVNHAGLRVRTAEELIEVQRRLEAAGIATRREEGVECCYARQTKFWVTDPDRMLWEIYILHEDIDERGDATVPTVQLEQVDIAPEPLSTWIHRLGEALPSAIPHETNSLHEVRLEGTLNAQITPAQRASLFAEAFRVLRPGGVVHSHGLAGDRAGNGTRPVLPGPAAAVEYVPTPSEIVGVLMTAGYVDVLIDTLSERAYFVVDGVPMREFRVSGKKPGHRPKQQTHQAIYKGPLAEVRDDYGNVFRRGELTPLNIHDWQMLSKSAAGSAFLFIEPATSRESAPATPGFQDRRSN